MLEAIRNRSTGIVVKGLLTLLILSFALWGIADVFNRSGTNTVVATVGDAEIAPDQVRRDFQREVERLSKMLGTRIDTDQARALGLVNGVLNRIVDRTLYDLAATDLGIVVSDDLVRQSIRNIPGLKNEKGEFDRFRFQQALQSNQLSEAGFVALTRGDIRRTQYLSMVGASPAAPMRMAEILFAYQNEKRVADILAIPYSSIAVSAIPDDAELAKYHSENAAKFTAPETRKLTYISLTASDLAKEIAISDDEIAKAYEARKDELTTPESRVLKQIRFKDEVSAKKAYDMLKGGADFATVAKDITGTSADKLNLGSMTKAQLLPGLAEAAFALQPGAFTKPLKSVLGWHILSLVKINPEAQKSLADSKKTLSRDLAAEKAIDALYQVANSLEDELGGGATLEEAAKKMNLPLRTIPIVDRTGSAGANAMVKGLPGSNFLDVAFSTPEGQDSPLTETGSDGYFIVRVDGVTAPALRPLASVRNDVIKAWTEDQQVKNAKKKVDTLIAKIKSGSDMGTLANTMGLTVTTTTPFLRQDTVKNVPAGLVADLFASSIGDISDAAGKDAHVIARLKAVTAANPVVDKAKFVGMRRQLSSAMRADLLGQLAKGLRQDYPVSVNQAALNALF